MATPTSGTASLPKPNTSVSGSASRPAAPAAALKTGEDAGEGGIVVNDHPVWRNLLRFGGLAIGIGGVVAGALALRGGGGGGLMQARTGGVMAAGVLAGAAMVGGSFLVKPTVVPFIKGNLSSQDEATRFWAENVKDDVALYQNEDGKFGLVDFRARDFDNEDLQKLDTGNKDVKWAGLLTRDGDLLRQVGEKNYQNVGRAYPKPVDLTRLAGNDADLTLIEQQQIGTTDAHEPASLGKRVGAPEGYATYQEATIAAHALGGRRDHAAVKVGAKFHLYEVKLPQGQSVTAVQARGAGIAPVSNVSVQEGNKVYRARTFGADLGFVSRATKFESREPIGHGIGGHNIARIVRSFPSREQAVQFIRTTYTNEIWTGRNVGVSLVFGKHPDGTGEWHVYQLDETRSRRTWDTQLGPAAFADLDYRTWRDEEHVHWYNEHLATEYDRSWDRQSVVLADVGGGIGNVTLRDTGPRLLARNVDWYATNSRRSYLRDQRIQEERRREAERQREIERQREAERQREIDRQRDAERARERERAESSRNSDDSGPGDPGFE